MKELMSEEYDENDVDAFDQFIYHFEPNADTLVIHPEDPSTDFLCSIYDNIDCDVFRDYDMDGIHVLALMPKYDRIIMLGHGCPDGLIGTAGLVVTREHVEVMRGKDLVCIWCNADRFMEKHKLKGFYSGMFISEVGEANCYDQECTQSSVHHSNELFADALGYAIDYEEERLRMVLEDYDVPGDDVVAFNRARLYDNSTKNGDTVVKYFCDGCGKELDDSQSLNMFKYKCHIPKLINGDLSRFQDHAGNAVSGREDSNGLCNSCYNKVVVPAYKVLREIQKDNGLIEK